jgi:hypothetical protein
MTGNEGSKTKAEVAEPKGKEGPLPLPGDGPMDDVGGALTLPGVRKIERDEAAR